MAEMITIAVEPLRRAMPLVVAGFGSAPAKVAAVADNLIEANLTGHDSHGIGMLPRYASGFLEGGLKPNAHVSTLLDAGALTQALGLASHEHGLVLLEERRRAMSSAHASVDPLKSCSCSAMRTKENKTDVRRKGK